MLIKKIYFLALLTFACSKDNSTPAPVTPPPADDEPKQYGVPFAAVPDARNAVVYEVNLRAFSEKGDLQGVIDRLDNLKSLGVNTLWLMPIFPVGQVNSAGGLGSPYAVKNYLEVNSELGTLDKLRELVQKAHDRNMAVILDWVANHTSWDNPWIANKAWYTQDAQGNIIIPPGTNWKDVADLNYDNGDMRKAMIRAMKYWVMEANIDGFRCDAVDFVPADFWKQALDALKALPNRKLILLAEGGKPDNFTSGFQMNYAWDFYSNLKAVYEDGKSATSVYKTHQAEYASVPEGGVKLRYTTNHDLSAWEETPVEAFGGVQGAFSASVVTILTSATPLLYSSQEVGRADKLPFFTREPINWNANPDLQQQYKKLLALYNTSPAFTKGTLTDFSKDNIVLFTRTLGTDTFLVAVNVRNTRSTIPVDNSLIISAWTNALDGGTRAVGASLELEPYQYLVLKK